MNAEIKARWVEALRSGKYKQGKGRLRSKDDCFCCLGVLCDVIDPTKWVDNQHAEFFTYEGSGASIQGEVCRTVELGRKFHQGELVCMNDTDNKTFPEIADWIEANL